MQPSLPPNLSSSHGWRTRGGDGETAAGQRLLLARMGKRGGGGGGSAAAASPGGAGERVCAGKQISHSTLSQPQSVLTIIYSLQVRLFCLSEISIRVWPVSITYRSSHFRFFTNMMLFRPVVNLYGIFICSYKREKDLPELGMKVVI
ncbi:hypothetical protein PVAP13_6KG231212 [Panicum virgatum]|uniref:Uncharacterized protein n=1 Tax=Panicum virgatum TaxID=38727 RepID=A0A8T0RCS3_PANVG|nr:hypothetical protein PVAP13_6KG231212 [Panicum virgatum]